MDYTFAHGRVYTREKSGTHFEVKIPDCNTIDMGLYDLINYVCGRFNVYKTSELTDEQYNHACAEYITALMKESKDFRKFVKEFC